MTNMSQQCQMLQSFLFITCSALLQSEFVSLIERRAVTLQEGCQWRQAWVMAFVAVLQ